MHSSLEGLWRLTTAAAAAAAGEWQGGGIAAAAAYCGLPFEPSSAHRSWRPSALSIGGMVHLWPQSAASAAAAATILQSGRVEVREVDASRWNRRAAALDRCMHVNQAGFLTHVELFDHARFGMLAAESAATDPQHRLLLECGSDALELWRGGRVSAVAAQDESHRDEPLVAVYTAVCHEDFRSFFAQPELASSAYASVGYAHSVASGRLSYVLDLRGPCMAIDAACASSHATLHAASHAVRADRAAAALVAG